MYRIGIGVSLNAGRRFQSAAVERGEVPGINLGDGNKARPVAQISGSDDNNL